MSKGYKMGGNCPRCKKDYTEYPALSRLDNKTNICSKCGTEEALYNFTHQGEKLPPLDQRAI
jgi:hypothetical protein